MSTKYHPPRQHLSRPANQHFTNPHNLDTRHDSCKLTSIHKTTTQRKKDDMKSYKKKILLFSECDNIKSKARERQQQRGEANLWILNLFIVCWLLLTVMLDFPLQFLMLRAFLPPIPWASSPWFLWANWGILHFDIFITPTAILCDIVHVSQHPKRLYWAISVRPYHCCARTKSHPISSSFSLCVHNCAARIFVEF